MLKGVIQISQTPNEENPRLVWSAWMEYERTENMQPSDPALTLVHGSTMDEAVAKLMACSTVREHLER